MPDLLKLERQREKLGHFEKSEILDIDDRCLQKFLPLSRHILPFDFCKGCLILSH
jgi:hypothetical protein